MRTLTVSILLGVGALAITLLAWADPASAFCFPAAACKPAPNPAPGPLIGFGALLVVRHFRQKD